MSAPPGVPSTHPYRATIPPVAAGEARPRWSVMIPTYNCARYLAETLASVLEQDPGPEHMQIEVVDDASSDEPRAVVEALGGGRVGFFRQPSNVGHTRNFATCLLRSRGELVHLLHGDDYVRPGFYRTIEQAFEQRQEIGAAFCRQIFMNERGQWLDLSPLEPPVSGILEDRLAWLAREQRIMTPSMVVRRSMYEQLGGFDERLRCSEDWEMWVRIAAHAPIWYDTTPLAAYRMHDNSNTGRHVRSAEDARYTLEAIRLFTSYLPPEVAPQVSREARRTYALAALRTARALSRASDVRGALNQAREALRMSLSPAVLRGVLRLAVSLGGAPLRRREAA